MFAHTNSAVPYPRGRRLAPNLPAVVGCTALGWKSLLLADTVEKVCSADTMAAATKQWFKDCRCFESSLLMAIDTRLIVSRDLSLRTFSTVSAQSGPLSDVKRGPVLDAKEARAAACQQVERILAGDRPGGRALQLAS